MILIRANSSEGMINALNSKGIKSTDCSVCAQPQIYKLLNQDGTYSHNVIIDPEQDYLFERVGEDFIMHEDPKVVKAEIARREEQKQAARATSKMDDGKIGLILYGVTSAILFGVGIYCYFH